MGKTGAFRYVLSLLALSFSAPALAAPDTDYIFIKEVCNETAQTVTLITPYLRPQDNPQAIIKNIHDGVSLDTYYLNDIEAAQKKVECNLGNSQIVSFAAAHNSIAIDLNGMPVPNPLLRAAFLHAEITIQVLGPHEVSARICQLQQLDNKADERYCQTQHIVNGQVAPPL